jgi:ribonuclease J
MKLDPRHTHLVPLGGTGEIGMNLNAYHHDGRWIVVDCGVMFEQLDAHRSQVLYPDASFLRGQDVAALVITHAHQDHLGAVRDLWPELRCPVVVTPFAAQMLKGPLDEAGLGGRVPLKIVGEDAAFRAGPFSVRRIPMTHSTLEMGALVLRTPSATVLHTGDWKLDLVPVEGRVSDLAAVDALGVGGGVDQVVSDSTNAHQPGWTPSEGSLVEPLTELVAAQTGRVAVTLFSSNVARVATFARVAAATGRHLVLLGRSLQRTITAARAAGYLRDIAPIVGLRDFGYLPPESVLMLCTGSQGERRAGLTRLAEDASGDLYLKAGDTVIYSARAIPGCELAIERVRRLFAERGVKVLTTADAHVHVSGHPRQDELRDLYARARPRQVVPVHGTPMHLDAHAELAEGLGLGAARIRNGDVLRLGQDPAVVGRVVTGRRVRHEPDRH